MSPEPDSEDLGPSSADRLDALESSETVRRDSERLDRRFELLEAILLSVAVVLAAWAGYQAAKWSGVQTDDYSQAGAARVEATRADTEGGQDSIADLVMFTEWLAAGEREGILDRPAAETGAYQPDPSLLSGFLFERFRPEFAVAVTVWLATDPRLNPDAPPSPFEMPEYQVAAKEQAAKLDRKAEALTVQARQANETSDNYVLMTIMVATVLLLAGISSKMDTLRARLLLLIAGAVIFVASAALVLSFPKQL